MTRERLAGLPSRRASSSVPAHAKAMPSAKPKSGAATTGIRAKESMQPREEGRPCAINLGTMDPRRLELLLARVKSGDLDVAGALSELRTLPFADLGYARVDHHRALRQ